jgi:hypothetical protein
MLHHEDAGVGKIIDREKFTARRAGSPDRYLRRIRELRLVETPDQRSRKWLFSG